MTVSAPGSHLVSFKTASATFLLLLGYPQLYENVGIESHYKHEEAGVAVSAARKVLQSQHTSKCFHLPVEQHLRNG